MLAFDAVAQSGHLVKGDHPAAKAYGEALFTSVLERGGHEISQTHHGLLRTLWPRARRVNYRRENKTGFNSYGADEERWDILIPPTDVFLTLADLAPLSIRYVVRQRYPEHALA